MTSTTVPAPGPGPDEQASPPLTLTARSPEDLLALAPVVLGFFPTDSVVMLTFGAEAAFHARVDAPTSAREVAEVVDSLLAPARAHRVRSVVLLVYGTNRPMARRLWSALRAGFEGAGIGIVQALRVEEERWYALGGTDERVREHGVPFDVSAHPFLVRAVVDGRVMHRSRAALAATLTTDPAAVEVIEALARAHRRRDGPSRCLLEEGEWIASTLAHHLAEGVRPGDAELARVLGGLTHLTLRDAAWSVLTRDRSRAAVAWWTHALTRSPTDLAAAPAALLAWSAWLHGNGALAWCALDRCEEAEPGYGLGRIVADLLERAHPPSSWPDAWPAALDWRAGLEDTTRAG